MALSRAHASAKAPKSNQIKFLNFPLYPDQHQKLISYSLGWRVGEEAPTLQPNLIEIHLLVLHNLADEQTAQFVLVTHWLLCKQICNELIDISHSNILYSSS